MIKALRAFFQSFEENSEESHEHQAELAATALLIETAKADHQIDEAELSKILEIAKQQLHLSKAEQESMIELAHSKSEQATSLYEFTSEIHENFSDQAKFELIVNMWKVAYADGQIDRYEEHIIRKVAELIYVPHVKFIEAKHLANPSNA